ncbi:MAG: hypothetical protein ACMUHB_06120 [Thermoplasmatota archaeon]
MTTRCPKCGKNNYGDVQKCSFCGAPLVFIPGEEIPQITEDDVQEKLSHLKAERIRNPLLMGGGGIVAVVGIFLSIILFSVFMIWVFSPGDVTPYMDGGSFHYDVPGGEEYIYGEITKVTEDGPAAEEQSYGYKSGYFAIEIDGDHVDKRKDAHEAGKTELEPSLWVYSQDKIGEEGDSVLLKVRSETNSFNEIRVVSEGKAGWGGSGWFSGGWIFLLPGFLLLLAGLAISIVGFIGKADRSMERLLEEDKEFRRQQLMLREAARKQMQVQQQQKQWSNYADPAMGQVQPQPMEGTDLPSGGEVPPQVPQPLPVQQDQPPQFEAPQPMPAQTAQPQQFQNQSMQPQAVQPQYQPPEYTPQQ